MGTSHSDLCNTLTKAIWEWHAKYNIWLTAAHIPGVDNESADYESLVAHTGKEWQLHKKLFQRALSTLNYCPDVDLFASRHNTQCKLDVSYRPDPGCMAVDAFSLNWHSIMFYVFPPFSVLTQTIQKIEKEEATGVVVAPNWPTQVWYPALMRLLIAHPLLLLSTRNTPSSQDPAVAGLSCVRKSLEETGISDQATTIMLKAWHQGTQKQYDTYLKEWVLYCNSAGCDPLSAPLYVGINYLADLAGRVGYSAVNTACSALSSVITLRDGSSFGKHPMVKRLLKGVFEDKPSLPRYGKHGTSMYCYVFTNLA